jgi:hypothetical protein
LLAALNRQPVDSDDEQSRIVVGALLVIEAFAELQNIRRLLQQPTE